MRLGGTFLIVVELVSVALGRIPYGQTRHTATLGDFKLGVTEEKRLVIPPVVSGLMILAGAVLAAAGSRGARL